MNWPILLLWALAVISASAQITIRTPMAPPQWALLERELLAANLPACREFYDQCYDERGYVKCFVRWGANDGPDDAFENFNRWPELHALGASDEILRLYLKGWEGMLKQYTEAKTIEVPIAQDGMYKKDFCVQADWMHLGEGLQLFNRMGLSVPTDAAYQHRARSFAGLYMGEDPEALNYDSRHKIIRSMLNGSKGPMLRKATALDWVGDSFDVTGFRALHGEHTYAQFLAHYQEYTDVVGDHYLNLAATALAMNAYMLAHEEKYKRWLLEYMEAWLERMKQNHGIIPSYVDLEGRIGGPEKKWWGNAYGWGFSPVNLVTGKRENRPRIPRALIGFNNALWLTGNQKYVDAWRGMIEEVNSHARVKDGRLEYPSMYGEQGWYGWQSRPWNVGALEIYYWSMKPDDLARLDRTGWIAYLQGSNPGYPEAALRKDLQSISQRLEAMRRESLPPSQRLADNMLEFNPAATAALVQLMWGGLPPTVDGGLINARLRYFDPVRQRAGIPEDVAALVSELSATSTVVTLVNLHPTESRSLIVQGGAYGEHQIVSASVSGQMTRVSSAVMPIVLEPGAGAEITLRMKRYANAPTLLHPWQRGK